MKSEHTNPASGRERPQKERAKADITNLSPDDWQQFRDLKLRSLEEEPIAFEDPEEGKEKYSQRTEREWRDVLAGKMTQGRSGESVQVFAKAGDNLVGMVSAIIPENPAGKVATIQHMYVDGQYRGLHCGKQLFESLIEKLKRRGDLKKVELQVIASQVPAVEMYKSFGFKEVGRKEKAVSRAGQELDEIEMELLLPRTERIEIPSTKGTLAAVVHYPQEKSDRLAVLCPAYLETKDYEHLIRLAEDLSAEGYAVVRFDFTGTWESEGSMDNYTVTQQLEDVKNVVDYMVREGGYRNVVIGGHSRGGMVSLLYAARGDPRVSAVVGIMSPYALGRTVSADKMAAWQREGFKVSKRDVPGKNEQREFRVPYSDFEGYRHYDLLRDIEKVHVPIVLVAGEKDDVVPAGDVREIFNKANEPKKMIVVEGIGHNYRNNPDEIKKVDEEILRGLDEVIAAAGLQK